MAKKPEYMEFQTLRANKSNKGAIITVKLSHDVGQIVIELSKQSGFNAETKRPSFDHINKNAFTLSDIECAKIVRTIEKEFAAQAPFSASLDFPHLTSNDPKNIKFEFGANPNTGALQMAVKVFSANDETRNVGIFLDEFEAEVIKEYLRASYSPVVRKQFVEAFDNGLFKEFVAGVLVPQNPEQQGE